MTAALLCSGQGRLNRGMLDRFAHEPAAGPILGEAAKQLGEDPLQFLRRASDEELHANRNSQILCVTRAMLSAAALGIGGFPADTLVAGYSVGEIAAWGVAGVWQAADAIAIAARRADEMDKAGGPSGGLGYIRGLPEGAVRALCAEYHCAIAIRNPGMLFVTGGERQDILALCKAASERGALRAAPMDVRIASHTPFLEAAVEPFAAALAQLPSRTPWLRLMSSKTQSLVFRPQTELAGLAAQISHAIDWEATLTALQERGVSRILELGPGSALAEMANGFSSAWEARSLDDFETLTGAHHWASR